MADHVLAAVRPAFRAAAVAFVPEATMLDERGWVEVERIVGDALARRPAAVRRQLRLFIRVLDLAALLRHGRRLPGLDVAKRVQLLAAVQDSPVLVLRRGAWGLRTLVFMGYYARPAAADEIGYRARADGWRARRSGVTGAGGQAT